MYLAHLCFCNLCNSKHRKTAFLKPLNCNCENVIMRAYDLRLYFHLTVKITDVLRVCI